MRVLRGPNRSSRERKKEGKKKGPGAFFYTPPRNIDSEEGEKKRGPKKAQPLGRGREVAALQLLSGRTFIEKKERGAENRFAEGTWERKGAGRRNRSPS